jgi:hypothetical protein
LKNTASKYIDKKLLLKRGMNMFALFGFIIFGLILGVIGLVLGTLALPLIIVVIVLGLVFSIIALIFNLLSALPTILIIVGVGAIIYSRNKRLH